MEIKIYSKTVVVKLIESSDQEEADTRSFLECADKIIVNSLDADVLLLLIHHSQHIHAEEILYFSNEDSFEYIFYIFSLHVQKGKLDCQVVTRGHSLHTTYPDLGEGQLW